jgi:hypothetical protein
VRTWPQAIDWLARNQPLYPGEPTKVVKAVLPAPLGPRSRKLLEGGEATAWKKKMWSAIGTPKVKRMAMIMATRLPSNSSVAMPVTEFQFA